MKTPKLWHPRQLAHISSTFPQKQPALQPSSSEKYNNLIVSKSKTELRIKLVIRMLFCCLKMLIIKGCINLHIISYINIWRTKAASLVNWFPPIKPINQTTLASKTTCLNPPINSFNQLLLCAHNNPVVWAADGCTNWGPEPWAFLTGASLSEWRWWKL